MVINMNLKITIQYDGTKYKGWQIQNNTEETIQGKIEAVLNRMFGYQIDVIGSGRTDAGVHAVAQVANFHLKEKTNLDLEVLLDNLNLYLPEDIAVTQICEVDERFHARFSAISKTYRYRIHIGNISNVFERKYVYNYKGDFLNVEDMKIAANYLLGEHDFKCFCANKHMKKSTVRTINSIDIEKTATEIVITYNGNGFLQNMVRIMTGTLIEVGCGKMRALDIPSILDSLDRERSGYTAPASGLCLIEVNY